MPLPLPPLQAFHNMGSSMSTLLRFPLGDFDYSTDMYQVRPALSPIYFVTFLVMIYLVSLNIGTRIALHELCASRERALSVAHCVTSTFACSWTLARARAHFLQPLPS
ncbi:hypothetical protein EON62_00585 [archaeon]|nr:MAG: hypothetical protein EON62_00585 [archaeon]